MTGSELPAQNEPSSTAPRAGGSAWAWPVTWMVTVLLFVAGGVYVFKSCRDLPGETIEKSGKLVQTARGVVSKDGKTMTNTFTGSDAAGRPVHNVVVFDKQP